MYRGRFVGVVDGGTSRDVLGLMMAGVPLEEAEAQVAAHAPTAMAAADAAVEREQVPVQHPPVAVQHPRPEQPGGDR
jgi:simple sugar transport system ATP-binding protein